MGLLGQEGDVIGAVFASGLSEELIDEIGILLFSSHTLTYNHMHVIDSLRPCLCRHQLGHACSCVPPQTVPRARRDARFGSREAVNYKGAVALLSLHTPCCDKLLDSQDESIFEHVFERDQQKKEDHEHKQHHQLKKEEDQEQGVQEDEDEEEDALEVSRSMSHGPLRDEENFEVRHLCRCRSLLSPILMTHNRSVSSA
jgi:hypothetical protein